jgi:hypothetical protein
MPAQVLAPMPGIVVVRRRSGSADPHLLDGATHALK